MGPNPNPNENTWGVLMDVVLEMIEEVRHAIPEVEDVLWSSTSCPQDRCKADSR